MVNPKEMADVEMAAVPGVSSDAELILKLQEKLTTLKGQIHTWKARSKGECQIQIKGWFFYVCHLFFKVWKRTAVATLIHS